MAVMQTEKMFLVQDLEETEGEGRARSIITNQWCSEQTGPGP